MQDRINSVSGKAQLIAALGWVLVSGSVWAAPFEVTTEDDLPDLSIGDGYCLTEAGNCSLRAAVQEANASGGRTITLNAGMYVLSRGNVDSRPEEHADRGDLDIRSNIIINGAGADVVAIDGMNSDRVFDVHKNARLTLNKVTVRNGLSLQHNASGGGIRVDGSESAGVSNTRLTLNEANVDGNQVQGWGGGGIMALWATVEIKRSTISRNRVDGAGGGIYADNSVTTIRDSTIRDNRWMFVYGLSGGGGIYNSGGSLTIERSAILNNRASFFGGGIQHIVGALNISNTTISGNTSDGWGGGLHLGGGTQNPYPLTNVTIAHNHAWGTSQQQRPARGGGVFVVDGVKLNLRNSILTNNGYGGNCYREGAAQVVREGTNLISDGSCGGTSTDSFSIGLGDLGFHGGPTRTHALAPFSPAINRPTNCFGLTIDQRSYERPPNLCDVGAYEFSSFPVGGGNDILPTPTYGGPPPVRDNLQPMAFDMPVGVSAGGLVSSVVSGADADGDPLEYEFVTLPAKGSVGWDGPGTIPGAFTYRANAGASGLDSFRFRVCDLVECSRPATVTIFIDSKGVTQSSGVQLVLTTGGQMGPLTVVSEAEINAVVADQQFIKPYGAFFFDVSDIPVDAGTNVAEVVVMLPSGAVIPRNAVVRKLDKEGVWHTLGEQASDEMTTAIINRAGGYIKLRLVDNDMFDSNPTPRIIRDPVALAVPVATLADDADGSDGGGGGGLWHPLWLLLAPLALALRRRG